MSKPNPYGKKVLKMKFVKFTRINSYGEEKDVVVNVDKITSLTENHTEPLNLYDSEGNLVETKEQPKVFEIILDKRTYKISEETFNALATELTK